MDELYKEWKKQLRNKKLRSGQALFNTCCNLYPDIADKLRGKEYDPFYQDANIRAFLTIVKEQLNATH